MKNKSLIYFLRKIHIYSSTIKNISMAAVFKPSTFPTFPTKMSEEKESDGVFFFIWIFLAVFTGFVLVLGCVFYIIYLYKGRNFRVRTDRERQVDILMSVYD